LQVVAAAVAPLLMLAQAELAEVVVVIEQFPLQPFPLQLIIL
jgi:hypothetical protein